MQTFYPPLKTYAEHRLSVTPPHELHVEEAGNPTGIPILVVHSGPGTGCEAFHRRFFDPDAYRIILFDQRGAGRSTPHTELENNTTPELINDMEIIREHLKIDRWVLWGGAWGSTLSLAYAIAHPDKVMGMILHSVFLGRQCDIDWFYAEGSNRVFPDYWDDFVAGVKEDDNTSLLEAYHQKLNGTDELARMAAAKSWSLWQAHCSALQPHQDLIDHFSDPHYAVGLATIESHYFTHACFMEENHILNHIDQIKHIPSIIIHGRYNMVCPLKGAWLLHKAWDASELYIIRDAGHSPKEPGIIDAIIFATKKMAKISVNLA